MKNLGPGEFYLYCPKAGGLHSLLSFGRSADKTTQERIQALVNNSSKTKEDDPKLITDDDPLAAGSWNSSPSTFRLGNGSALVVQFGLFEVVGDLQRVQPSVYHDLDRNAVCIFQGYLSNLDELKERYGDILDSQPDSPTAVVNRGRDPCEIAAKIIFCMHMKGSDPLVLLSELQGQYSFTLYDGERRQIFLARDSSEKEPLYYEIEDNGAINVSNALLSVPSDVGEVHWSILPPGHYIAGHAGKSTKVQQFALTPRQLSIREWYETLDDELSPHAGDTSSGKRSLSDELADVTIEG